MELLNLLFPNLIKNLNYDIAVAARSHIRSEWRNEL